MDGHIASRGADRTALRAIRGDDAPFTSVARGESALSPGRRVLYTLLWMLWIVVVVRFWLFWGDPEHRGATALYVPATLAFAYLMTGLPTIYWFYVGRMRRPVPVAAPEGLRVAMITLCVPSHESIDVIERQLRSLVAVRYPHDSWVLDEGGDPEVERLARAVGVRYFSRKGVLRWNKPGPPFQAKTKAGNVNAWLDSLAGADESYEFFVQLDIDHRPRPEYLERTLGYFADPVVGWVQAPSVSANLRSWTARGLAEQDVVLQGPLQMGFYGHSGTPFIIGSHTTYRTAAVHAIGGFQPTRAEDHLDTVVLAAAGYRGVYVPVILAEGEGPEDLGTYLGQQFAWAYSMVQILLFHTPRLLRRYTPRQSVQFLMAQSWYTLWSLAIAVLWVLPIAALLSEHPITTMPLGEFLAYYLAAILTSTLLWWASRHWFPPQEVRLSWRGVLLEIARWPIVLWAVINVLLRVKRPYMITRKGAKAGHAPNGLRLYGPYFALLAAGLGAIFAFVVAIGHAETQGYLALVLLNDAFILAFLVAAIGLELGYLRRRLGSLRAALRARVGAVATLALLCLASVAAVAVAWAPLAEAVG
jgi:cellulose synthase (UDP-forming)